MSTACDTCPAYFHRWSACPTVPFSDFSERPLEFLISLWMANSSAFQLYDFLIVLFLLGTKLNRFHFVISFATSTLLVNGVFKEYFNQPRPALSCIHGPGMPSGHSTAAGAIFTTIIILYSKGWIKNQRFVVLYCLFLMNEAYSRMYLHYHTEGQVIAGFLWGSLSTVLFLGFLTITPYLPKIISKRSLVIEGQYYRNLTIQNERMEALMV